MKIILSILFLVLSTTAHADCWQVGACESPGKLYANVQFKVDECSTLDELKQVQKDKRGIIVKEKDVEKYMIIYHSKEIAAPESVYINCTKGMEED